MYIGLDIFMSYCASLFQQKQIELSTDTTKSQGSEKKRFIYIIQYHVLDVLLDIFLSDTVRGQNRCVSI